MRSRGQRDRLALGAAIALLGMAIVAIASDRRRSGRLLSNGIVGGARR
jgi:hypothetical protein